MRRIRFCSGAIVLAPCGVVRMCVHFPVRLSALHDHLLGMFGAGFRED